MLASISGNIIVTDIAIQSSDHMFIAGNNFLLLFLSVCKELYLFVKYHPIQINV